MARPVKSSTNTRPTTKAPVLTSTPPTPEAVATMTRRLVRRLRAEIRSGALSSAQEADERAAELAGESEYDIGSDAQETVLSALCDVTGRAFPGDWEDYD